jgi:hypothetical protein
MSDQPATLRDATMWVAARHDADMERVADWVVQPDQWWVNANGADWMPHVWRRAC